MTGPSRRVDDEFLTKRETDLRWRSHEAEHEKLTEDLRIALAAVERERAMHATAHNAAHDAHNREHALDARNAVQLLESHAREHALEADALDKAASAVDKRLEGMNEVRSQLKEQAIEFARSDVVQALFERAMAANNSLTDRVIAIEKLDIKSEGRGLGQGAVVAYIVTAVTIVGALLGIVVVIANFASAS